MRFTKIKYDGEKLELRWHTGNLNGTVTEHKQTSTEQPSPEFIRALAAFQAPTEALLEIERDGESYFDRVSGLSISEEDDEGYRGMIITLSASVAELDDELLVNTPRIPINSKWLRKVETLEDHAERFTLGARMQGNLFPAAVTQIDEEKSDEMEAGLERGAQLSESAPAKKRSHHKKKPAIEASIKVTGASPEFKQAIEESAERAGFTMLQ